MNGNWRKSYGAVMARKRSEKNEIMNYPHTPEKQLEVKSGWCITSDHNLCKYSFSFGKCVCNCHL